jgi:hypothetical protein
MAGWRHMTAMYYIKRECAGELDLKKCALEREERSAREVNGEKSAGIGGYPKSARGKLDAEKVRALDTKSSKKSARNGYLGAHFLNL